MNRPAAVAVLAVMIFISAVYNIVIGILLLLAPIGANPTFIDLAGNEHEVSTFYLFLNGAIDLLFGLLMVWLGRITLFGSREAYVLINVLAVINLVFALLSLPFGWVMFVVSIIALILVNLPGTKAFLSQRP